MAANRQSPCRLQPLAQQLWEAVGGSPGLEGTPNPCLGPGDRDIGNCSPESAGLRQPQVPPSWCPGSTATPRPAEEGPLQRAGVPKVQMPWFWVGIGPGLSWLLERPQHPGTLGAASFGCWSGPSPAATADGRGDPMPRPSGLETWLGQPLALPVPASHKCDQGRERCPLVGCWQQWGHSASLHLSPPAPSPRSCPVQASWLETAWGLADPRLG